MQDIAKDKTTFVFADKLLDLIANSGKTIKTLSKETGISEGSLSKYQNAEGEAGIKKLLKLAQYFNVSADYLLGLTKVKTPDIEIQAVSKMLGLSEGAIDVIRNFDSEKQKTLSNIIENDKFGEILSGINEVIKQKSLHDKYVLGTVETVNKADGVHATDIIVRLGLNDVVASISNLNESTDYKVLSTKGYIEQLRYRLNNIFEGFINEVTYFKDFDTNIFTRLMQLIDAGDDDLYKLKMKVLKSAQDGAFEKTTKKGVENFIMSKNANIEKNNQREGE